VALEIFKMRRRLRRRRACPVEPGKLSLNFRQKRQGLAQREYPAEVKSVLVDRRILPGRPLKPTGTKSFYCQQR
jgi:hypothetical protein